MCSKFGLIFLILCFFVGAGLCMDCSKNPSDSAKPEHKLRYQLFCKGEYDPLVRPVKNHEDNITVSVYLIVKFFSVDERSNKFLVHSWVMTEWFDADLAWTPSEHNGIERLYVSSSAIWLPDLAILNSDMSQTMLYSSTDCTVESTGKVKCAPDLQAPLYCDVNLQKWPYDTQKCILYIGLWAHTSNLVDIVLHQEDSRNYVLMKSGRWELLKLTSQRDSINDGNNLAHPELIFDFELRRHAAMHAASVIGPAFALAGLTMSTFLMKSLAMRCVICCTGIICNTLFLQYVGWNLPADGDTCPTIISFYRDTFILNLTALLLAIITDQMRSAGDGGCTDLCGGQAPEWLVGAATFVRGRGGKAGQLILGENNPQPEEISPQDSKEGGIPQCKTFATFVDRTSFLAFGIVQISMLIALNMVSKLSFLLFVLLCFLVGPGLCVDCSKSPTDAARPEHKLRYELFCNREYDPLVRPVKNREDTITVNVSLDLKYISVDDHSNQFWVHSWVVTKWLDVDLIWQPSDYSGINLLSVSSGSIWLPDLAIYNSDMSQIMLYASTDCVVMSTGQVKCAPDLQAPIYCDMKLQKWPFDTQNCSLFIGSWANSGNLVDVILDRTGLNQYSFMNSNAWELLKVTPSRNAYTYANNMSYPYIRYNFEVRRHAAMYAASVIGPAFALAGLTLLSFLLDNLAVRCLICCTSLICDTLFLQYVGWFLPADGDTSPTIISFYRDTLILNLAAIAIAIITDQMRSAGEGGCADLCGGQAPEWLVGAATFVRGRGGKAGQLLLGEHDLEQQSEDSSEVLSPRESEKRGIPQCKMFATFVDRIAFLVFGIVQLVMLIALVP
ncbi:uncharacterized protein LOC132203300 [Neocloeon triangulifer]|uniref:uncharacterized protein LOC132203300 n=1 Tax=Neocloeon triangulifer TaxID=2078957 RepID=UPI00286ECCE5|nr:uncharacterized protein LOC132203300 [Neocloeon triangulifer]